MPPKISVIVATFEHGKKLSCLLDCLAEQHGIATSDWEGLILHDGPSEMFEQMALRYANIENLEFKSSERRENLWGHNLREMGLALCSGEYCAWTNGDNQVCYGWLERLIPVLKTGPDLVTWHISHSYSEFHDWTPQLRPGGIDFCSYAMKTSLAKEMGFPWRHREADGAQIQEFTRRWPDAKVIHMPNTFAFHN